MINKVILVGNLGADPEVRYMPNAVAVTTISLATSRRWKDKNTGEKKEETEWHRVVLFNRLAEIAGEYLRKGSQIYVEGRIRTRKWQDQGGQDRYSTEVIGETMNMIGGKGDQAEAGKGQSANNQAAPSKNQSPPTYDAPDFDDDIPF